MMENIQESNHIWFDPFISNIDDPHLLYTGITIVLPDIR